MLVVLGLLMVVTFMFLIITKRATPVVALILVPVAFGLFAGAGLGISDMISDGMAEYAIPTPELVTITARATCHGAAAATIARP